MDDFPIKLGVKCAPDEKIFNDIEKAGIKFVELFTSEEILRGLKKNVQICKKYNFNYIVHAPNLYFNAETIVEFAKTVNARIIVMHNILWEDEWQDFLNVHLKNSNIMLVVENTK